MSAVEQNYATLKDDELLAAWAKAQRELINARSTESVLRENVIKRFSQVTDEMASGMENIDIGFGYDLKIERKLNYKLATAKEYEAVHKVIDAIEAMGPAEQLIADRLFKQKFDISVSEYKLLDGASEIKKLVDSVLTITAATPSVEIKERKK